MTDTGEMLHEVHRRFVAALLSYGHGTDNAWDEAVALVLGVTGLPDTEASLDVPVPEKEAADIRKLAERRATERQPLAYLLGRTSYCGETFVVPPGVIVPRSPIGPLLGDGLQRWVKQPNRILDLCCGTGCLGILAAKRFPTAQVVLADVDPLAVATAQRNVTAHGLEERVKVLRSDLFSDIPGRGEVGVPNNTYDLILCNPPYVDAETMASLPAEFTHEPALGLSGGGGAGLAIMNQVLSEASRYLAKGGVVIGEVGDAAAHLEAQWPKLPFFWPDLPDGGTGVFLLQAADTP